MVFKDSEAINVVIGYTGKVDLRNRGITRARLCHHGNLIGKVYLVLKLVEMSSWHVTLSCKFFISNGVFLFISQTK